MYSWYSSLKSNCESIKLRKRVTNDSCQNSIAKTDDTTLQLNFFLLWWCMATHDMFFRKTRMFITNLLKCYVLSSKGSCRWKILVLMLRWTLFYQCVWRHRVRTFVLSQFRTRTSTVRTFSIVSIIVIVNLSKHLISFPKEHLK